MPPRGALATLWTVLATSAELRRSTCLVVLGTGSVVGRSERTASGPAADSAVFPEHCRTVSVEAERRTVAAIAGIWVVLVKG